MLVIPCDDVTAFCEGHQILERLMRAHMYVRDDQRRRVLRRRAEHPQPHTQGDRRLLGHPGELAASDHSDNWHLTWTSHAQELSGPNGLIMLVMIPLAK